MALVDSIESNATGLRIAEEASMKVLPGSPIWLGLEPNSYSEFGGQVTNVARNPINDGRQNKKGVLTDLDASGGINSDLTQANLQEVLQGHFYADLRLKGEELVTAVDVDTSNPDEYQVAATAGFQVDDLILGSNFVEAVNNALNVVTAIVTDTSVEVLDGQLTDEAGPPADAQITVVGHQFQSAEVDVDVTNPLPRIVRASGVKDFTDFGVIPGEWMFVGGDGAAEDFVNAENNGWKRVRAVAATYIEFDKSDITMTTETGTGLTIRLFFGRVLKNEVGSLIVRRSWQLERTLGAPDDALPAEIQAEYIEGARGNEATFNIPQTDKVTVDLTWMGVDNTTIDGATSLKSGARPDIEEADAFNTSSDFSRINLSQVIAGNEAPTPLFVFAQDLSITINNNLNVNKAVGTLGGFNITLGQFEVGGSITAYFADVASIDAVRSNLDITIDVCMAKQNSGIAIDLPLITLGDGRPEVAQDQPITLPLTMAAATGAKIDSTLNHTLLMVFFDYLPDAAEV